MANIQQLIFDIIARDSASPAFAKLGATAQGAAGNVSDLSKRIDELGRRSAEARVGLAGGKEAQARPGKLDPSLLTPTHPAANPNISIEGAARAAAEISALELQLDKLGSKSAPGATSALSGLAGTGGMGALIAAGVALSPVIITLGTGLAGLAVAGYSTISPILKAAQATGGLSANMHKLNPEQQQLAQSLLGTGSAYHQFAQQLQPEVFAVFNAGIKLAGQLMHDIEPVTAATGASFATFLGQFGATLQSPQWTQFWAFMAATAPQDMQLLGNVVIGLAKDMPLLVESLQPVAVTLLQVTGDVLKLIDAGDRAIKWEHDHAAAAAGNTGALGKLAHAAEQAFGQLVPGAAAARTLASDVGKLSGPTDKAGASMHAAIAPAQTLAQQLQSVAAQTTAVMTAQQTALTTQLGYGSAILTSANDAQALRDKLSLSSGMIGLQTQKQRGSFGAAQAYIKDLGDQATQAFASGHGVDAAMTAIRNGLPLLDSAKTKNKQYWQEVQILVGWLDKLRQEKAISEAIHVSGTGVWSVTPGKIGLPGGTAGGPFPQAAGGMIRGGIPGRDSVLISAMPGEVVVPAGMVAAGLVDHLRGALPGFAGGGVVGSYAGNVAGLGPWAGGELNATAQAIAGSVAQALTAGVKAAIAGAGAGGAGVTRWAPLILQVLAMLGPSPANLGPAEHRLAREGPGGVGAGLPRGGAAGAAGGPGGGGVRPAGGGYPGRRGSSCRDRGEPRGRPRCRRALSDIAEFVPIVDSLIISEQIEIIG